MANSLTDEELFARSRYKGDEFYNALIERYIPKARKIILFVFSKMNQKNQEIDEYMFDFLLSFNDAYEHFSLLKGKFHSFFKVIFKRRLQASIARKINSSDALDHSFSLDEEIGDGIRRIDVIENKLADDPVSSYNTSSTRLFLEECTKHKRATKSNLKYRVFLARYSGMSLRDIAKKYDISVSKVRRLLDASTNDDIRKLYVQLKK